MKATTRTTRASRHEEARGLGMLFLIVVMVGGLLAGSCRSHKDLAHQANDSIANVADQPEPPKPPVVRLDTIQNAYYRYYSANFSCEVDGMRVNGQIRIVHDSAIWISVNKVIEVGRALITPTRVQGYVKLLNKQYDGSYSDVVKRWGLDLDYATLEALLTGNCPPHCVKHQEPERNGDQVTLHFTQKSAATGKQRQVTMQKSFKRKKIQQTDIVSGELHQQVTCNYGRPQTINGQELPTEITLNIRSRVYSGATQVKLEKIVLNQPQGMPFKLKNKH